MNWIRWQLNYRYMNFNEIQSFQALADDGQRIAATLIEDEARSDAST